MRHFKLFFPLCALFTFLGCTPDEAVDTYEQIEGMIEVQQNINEAFSIMDEEIPGYDSLMKVIEYEMAHPDTTNSFHPKAIKRPIFEMQPPVVDSVVQDSL